ncbi:MAG TPA: mechanosensitive ion channel domain-containing protein [Gammaproteobacteria bacterium]|nr:mechanosensitive ion channel domain-containing protein [Gammaproteobacteria bacterium]
MSTASHRNPSPTARPAPRLLPGLLLWLAWCLAGSAPAYGQLVPGLGISPEPRGDSSEARAENGPARAEPAVIQAERIPAQMEQSRQLARRATEAARPHADIDAIRAQMSALAAQIDQLGERSLSESLARIDLRSLEGALEQVASLRRTISAWQTTLGRRAAELSGWRADLSLARRSWSMTEEDVTARELPAEILAGSRNLQAALRDAATRLGARQDEILVLQSTLNDWLSIIAEREAVIQAELAQARIALFQPEHPPLWKSDTSSLAFAASQEAWLADWQALRAYLLERQGNVLVHFALLVLLLGAFATLARKVRAWTEEKPDLATPLAVFRHPLAAALVLAILVGPWLYPDAPVVLRELFALLLILPLLRVLPLIVAPALRGALYVLAGLYLLLKLNGLLGVGTELERYGLLLLTASAAAAVAWIFKPAGRAAALEAGRWWRAARLATRLSLIVLAAAIFANIGGLVTLSGLLTNAVISSAFVAIVLFAGVVVTRAMIIALFQTRPLQHFNLVRWHSSVVDHWIMRILPLIALVAWLLTTARLFRIDGVLGGALSAMLFSSVSIGTVEISLGDVLGFGLAIWLGLLASRALRFVLSVDVFPRVTLPRGVAATVSMLVNYLVLGIAFVLAVAAAGIQLDRFALIVGALSVGIGFGLTNIINNFVSGLILAFERPIQSGDTVEFSSMFGKVTRIGVRSSTVRTFDGAEVIVPNANLISNEVTNWTLSDMRRRMEILVGVAYGTNPHKVLELLLKVAKADERLLETPEPNARFLGFGDSSLDFSLRAWSDDFDNYLTIKSDVTLAVHDALYAAGMEIPFPQRDLHLRSVDAQTLGRFGGRQSPEAGDGDAAEPAEDAAARQAGDEEKPG